jgi:hypothetical protein
MGKNFTFVTARQIWAGLRGRHVEFWEASFLVHSDPKICTSSSSYCAEKFSLKPETRRALHNARRGVEFLAVAMVNVRLHRILAIGLFLLSGSVASAITRAIKALRLLDQWGGAAQPAGLNQTTEAVKVSAMGF